MAVAPRAGAQSDEGTVHDALFSARALLRVADA
jgi:hypothetical protein